MHDWRLVACGPKSIEGRHRRMTPGPPASGGARRRLAVEPSQRQERFRQLGASAARCPGMPANASRYSPAARRSRAGGLASEISPASGVSQSCGASAVNCVWRAKAASSARTCRSSTVPAGRARCPDRRHAHAPTGARAKYGSAAALMSLTGRSAAIVIHQPTPSATPSTSDPKGSSAGPTREPPQVRRQRPAGERALADAPAMQQLAPLPRIRKCGSVSRSVRSGGRTSGRTLLELAITEPSRNQITKWYPVSSPNNATVSGGSWNPRRRKLP